MITPIHFGLSGQTANTVIGASGSAAGAAVSTAVAAGSIGGPLGIALALAITGIVVGLQALFNRRGPRQRIEASKIVDGIEPFFQENLKLWENSNKTPGEQAAALQGFDQLWSQVVTELSNPAYGNPGKVGLEERGRNGRPYWGKNWFELYRDPIANAETVSESVGIVNMLGGGNAAIWALAGIAAIVGLKLVTE
jgi:hypothetical protein